MQVKSVKTRLAQQTAIDFDRPTKRVLDVSLYPRARITFFIWGKAIGVAAKAMHNLWRSSKGQPSGNIRMMEMTEANTWAAKLRNILFHTEEWHACSRMAIPEQTFVPMQRKHFVRLADIGARKMLRRVPNDRFGEAVPQR
nr:hypothetical protein [Thioclava sp. F28-4]